MLIPCPSTILLPPWYRTIPPPPGCHSPTSQVPCSYLALVQFSYLPGTIPYLPGTILIPSPGTILLPPGHHTPISQIPFSYLRVPFYYHPCSRSMTECLWPMSPEYRPSQCNLRRMSRGISGYYSSLTRDCTIIHKRAPSGLSNTASIHNRIPLPIFNLQVIDLILTRRYSCVTARGIPSAA